MLMIIWGEIGWWYGTNGSKNNNIKWNETDSSENDMGWKNGGGKWDEMAVKIRWNGGEKDGMGWWWKKTKKKDVSNVY